MASRWLILTSAARRYSNEDGRGGAVGGPHVRMRAWMGALDRVVVDDEVDLREVLLQVEALLQERRLHVHHGHPVELVEGLGADLLDLDVEDLAHGHVLGARDGAEGAEGGRHPGAAEQRLEGQRRGDGVGIGVVLHQDEDALVGGEVRPDSLGARPLGRPLERGLHDPLRERAPGNGHGAGNDAILVAHHDEGRLRAGLGHGRAHPPDRSWARHDHDRTPSRLDPAEERGVAEVAEDGALAAAADARAERGPVDQKYGVLNACGGCPQQ